VVLPFVRTAPEITQPAPALCRWIGMKRRAWDAERMLVKPGAAMCKLALARMMRAAPTAGELTLWRRLRDCRLHGWKFRRQHVIAGYIVDFYCHEFRVAIEVDGPSHDGRAEEDARRDTNLRRLGVRVLRVSARDVRERIDIVLRQVTDACVASRRARRTEG